HRSLVNLVTWYHKHIITSPQDRATLIAGPAFDASVANIWPTITAGASLYIPDEETRLSPDLLLDWYASNKITVSYLPTPLATLLIDLNQPVGLVLRILLAGGDKLTKGPTEALPYRFINLYGPTESTVETTWADIAAGHVAPPIGRPISNTQVYILDAQLRPVPIGVVGELYIGGDGLARGYLNRPELTAERFISNPLPGTLGERLYRTGDLVRYRADGNIEFVSRNDDQVKIRGFRIELGEIETTLSRHPQVRDSIVMVREEEAGEKRLVAYVVTGQVAEDFRTTLRDCLKKTLPEYMVPTAFITLDAFPLTPNGKVDKQALSALDPAQSLDTEYVAPGTPFEEELAAIWCELLRLDRVGIHDNFFQLGGHSLLVMQVISRIKSVFQIDLALQTFFEYPTVAGISRIVINTKMEKADDRDLESILSELEEITEIVRRENFSPSPVSFTQWRLWFLDQLAPGSPVYNIPSAVRLEGVLDVEALEAALNALVDRHEVLRTRFGVEEGNPVQLIATELKVPLPVDDLGGIPQQEQEAELQKRIQSEYNVPFDLAQCPLLRARLLRLGERTHVLVLTLHHIISDGWSMYVLMGELSVLYGACCQSEPSPLPALRVQYADYAIWHREWLQGEVLAEQLSYWQEQLKDLSVLNFPTDRPYPARQSYKGEEQYCDLPAILTERLEELGQRAGATLFMTLLAAFQMLLQRYSGQDDIVVGSPIAGRNKVDTESLIGFFVNTLVLRTDLSGDPTFMELLKRVREVALGAYAHQDLPFDKLVEELRPERALSRNPLFDVLINFHVERDDNSGVFGSPDLKISPEKFSQKLSKFAFTLYIRLVNGQLKLELAYRTDMLDSDRMRCLLQQFQHLLEQIVAMPEQTIQSYSLVTPESHKLLPDPTVILDEPQQQTIPEIFAGIAARLPDNVAVSQNNKNWTYDDLNKASLRLAATLHVQGAEPGDVIAVFGRRSFGLIASLLAVLRAGGVILPVDNSLPPGRQEIMFRESRARMILNIDGDTALHAGLETLHVNAETGCLDGVISDCESGVTGFTEPGANDPAYIFFTSGSTGIPKAVLGCHKSLSHFLCWQRDKFAVGPGDRVAQLTALSFDVVLRDIFLPLTSGGTVCLPEDKDLVNILQWVEREAITVIHSVPAVIRLWLESRHEGASLHSLRWLFVAGEPLTDVLVQQWRAAFPVSGMMVNLYGATETALVKCFHLLDGEIKNGIQLIGDALPQTQALVLRRNRQLCGIGETGEIVIRTPFMTLGYLNNEAENRKRFIKNPFRDDEQDMLYFTGDRGCYRPDGKLEIRGRLDEQVKIRGIRIEPAEVAATLSLHDSIHDCTVITQKDQSDNCALVAYVVPEKNSGITAGELRTDLGYYLQGAFIPSAFIFMEQLPLLPNGKVDRKALPAANLNNPDPGQKPVTPRTPVEKILAELWMTVLGIKQVGIHDNFFHLGGHSLLVIKAILRINSVLRTEFPLVTFFQLPTIAEQASRIEQDRLGNIHERVEGILDELESLPEEDQ
ncbi:MAG TPA: amino acid adenylation domain-containing protein, partial [Gammaproteobacteria bacterium]|nr:amino acid adenylation domain-containing protein [Gammaproteobacteria bacterium]